MSETPDNNEGLVPDPADTAEETPDVVETPEAESTTPPAWSPPKSRRLCSPVNPRDAPDRGVGDRDGG